MKGGGKHTTSGRRAGEELCGVNVVRLTCGQNWHRCAEVKHLFFLRGQRGLVCWLRSYVSFCSSDRYFVAIEVFK